MTRCAVVGAGAWGTALADLLARNGHSVVVWAHEADVAEAISTGHENVRFLAGVPLHPRVTATTSLGRALDGAALVCLATPSHLLRGIFRGAVDHLDAGATLCVASKGIEPGTLALMSDVVTEEAPGHPVVALSGPSFASEVAARQPTAIVAASDDERASTMVQDSLSNTHFRVYTHDDIVGVNQDVIYVSNAPATDLQKFFGIINGSLGTVSNASRMAGG